MATRAVVAAAHAGEAFVAVFRADERLGAPKEKSTVRPQNMPNPLDECRPSGDVEIDHHVADEHDVAQGHHGPGGVEVERTEFHQPTAVLRDTPLALERSEILLEQLGR